MIVGYNGSKFDRACHELTCISAPNMKSSVPTASGCLLLLDSAAGAVLGMNRDAGHGLREPRDFTTMVSTLTPKWAQIV